MFPPNLPPGCPCGDDISVEGKKQKGTPSRHTEKRKEPAGWQGRTIRRMLLEAKKEKVNPWAIVTCERKKFRKCAIRGRVWHRMPSGWVEVLPSDNRQLKLKHVSGSSEKKSCPREMKFFPHTAEEGGTRLRRYSVNHLQWNECKQ